MTLKKFILLFIISNYFFLTILKDNQKKTTPGGIKKIKSDADLAYYKNDYTHSAILFDSLIKLDTTKGEYYFKRGYSFSMFLNADQAIKDYLKSISLGYRVADAYKNIAVNYTTINDSLAMPEETKNGQIIIKQVETS